MTNPLLVVEDLSVTLATDRGPARVVRNLGLTVPRSGTLGIVGESGCGKSMTALALMRLLPETATASGRILLDGTDLLGLSEREMCEVRGNRMGMVFQEPMTALNPAHTVGHQVAEALVVHGKMGRVPAQAEAGRLLDLVGIPQARSRLNAFPHEFSGGQRQRVVIAIALACRPAVLIADEPTTALDVTVQTQILNLLDLLVADLGMALVLISHDLGVIGRLCDHVVVMYAGTAIEQGTVEAVFRERRHPYTRGLFGALPEARQTPGARLYAIPGTVPSPIALPQGCKFADRCEFAIEACRPAEPELVAVGQTRARCVRATEFARE